jgi:hypothetical protein
VFKSRPGNRLFRRVFSWFIHFFGAKHMDSMNAAYAYYIVSNLLFIIPCHIRLKKGKATPVTGRGGLWVCETSRLPHFLDSRLTEGGEVSLTLRPSFTPRKIPGTNFC